MRRLTKSIDAIVVSGSAVADVAHFPTKDVNTSTTVGANDVITVLLYSIFCCDERSVCKRIRGITKWKNFESGETSNKKETEI